MTEVITKINMAIQVLNHINTSGKQNLLNLGGAIGLLEEVAGDLGKQINAEQATELADE